MGVIKHFRAVSKGFPLKKKALFHEYFIKKDDTIMKRRKRRLNPIYWIFQYLGAGIGLLFMFFAPYLVEKIIPGGC